MSDTSRRCVLNHAFQVLKPPCLQRVRCFVVVAAVFFIRGILNDPWLLGRPWRQESWGPIAVATNWCQWERALVEGHSVRSGWPSASGSHGLFPPPGRRGGQTLSTVGALSAFAFCLSINETTEHRHISGAVYLVGSRRLMNYAIA